MTWASACGSLFARLLAPGRAPRHDEQTQFRGRRRDCASTTLSELLMAATVLDFGGLPIDMPMIDHRPGGDREELESLAERVTVRK